MTLVLTHADQATRRAIRSLGDPSEHRRTFAATEGELLAGDHTGVVWQQCGSGLGEAVRIAADASLAGILALAERLLDTSYSFLGKNPEPNPGALYPSGVQATLPEPTEQLNPALSVQLTRAEKDALDLLAAWPLCTREELAGLMGGVTLRRGEPGARSLTQRGLVRSDEPLHMLTDEGLTYLARRDRAAVGLTLDRWSAEPLYLNADIYAGTAVRALASQMRHHAGVISFAAACQPRSSAPPTTTCSTWCPRPAPASATATTGPPTSSTPTPHSPWNTKVSGVPTCWSSSAGPRRRSVPAPRLKSYRRYFQSGWAERDHDGLLPRVLFVFESPGNENAFLDVADTVKGVPIITSNAETIAERGILGDAWILPPPHSLDRRPLSALDPAPE